MAEKIFILDLLCLGPCKASRTIEILLISQWNSRYPIGFFSSFIVIYSMMIHFKCWHLMSFKRNTWLFEVEEKFGVVELVDDLP